MADFSIGDALGSGFGLMVRRPLSVLAWGLTYLIIGVALPLALVGGVIGSAVGGDFVSYFANLRYHASDLAQFAQMMAPLHAQFMVVQPIMWLTSLVVQAVLTAAVFRATLEPRQRGLAYLGLGAREWWLGLLSFVARFLAAILAVVLAVAGLALGFGLYAVFEAQHLDQGLRVLAFVALGAVLLAVFIGILVRFSLAAPMTFAERQFRLFESWGMTRRHGWKLFGLALLLALVSIVMVLVFEAVGAGIVLLISGGLHWSAAAFWTALLDQRQLWSTGLGEGLVVLVLLIAYGFGGLFAVSLAPWAVVYRALSSTPSPSPREGGVYVPAPLMMDPEPGLAPPPAPEPAPSESAPEIAPAPESELARDDHAPPESAADDQGVDDDAHGEHGAADPHANTDEGGDGHDH